MASEVIPDVYDITCREDEGRRYRAFLFTDGVPTLFDVGYEDTVEVLFEEIAAIGVEPERVVLTHGDRDHAGGFDAVVERYDVESWVPAATDLDARNDPDHRFGDAASIGRFTAVHVPGHTPGNSSFVDEGRGVLVMGDSLFGADMRGLPPGHVILPPAIYSDDLALAERNLEKLLAYDYETALLFHGTTLVEDAKAKVEAFVEFPGKAYYVEEVIDEDAWGPTV